MSESIPASAIPDAGRSAFSEQLTVDELSEITRHLLRSLPDALVVVDASGRICFANETVGELFGYPAGRLIGEPLDILIPSRLRARHGSHLATYIRNPHNREMGARIADLFAARADGSEFPADIRLAPFRIGEKLLVASAIRDMTERRVVSDELVSARQEAERANRAKSRFLATASHDLRQPMQTIRLLNATLLRIAPERDVREVLRQQELAIEGMTRLLNALLDISRLESGAIEPVVAEVSLSDLFAELRSEFESVARARGLDLRIEPWDCAVATDRNLFSQLLQNLLGNAIKYTDRGSVCVRCQRDADALLLLIEDTGIGIPADKLDRIFDEYYQVDTHGAKRLGVGLGLAIVKEVARLLGLTVEIASVVGSGTQVRICIPGKLLITPSRSGGPTHPSPSHAPGDKPRVLLVEDNDGVRLATEVFLKFEGYDIRSASSVAQAEEMFRELHPRDVVIADYHLDSRNTGLDMLTRLRAQAGYEVPGIILSGDLPTVLRTIKAPVHRCKFLSKPVDTAELLEAIAELSATASSRHQDRGAA